MRLVQGAEFLSRLNFGRSSRSTLILQTEAAECGLACIAMVASHYKYKTDMLSLRERHSISLKGATLKDLSVVANSIGLSSRALRLELDELKDLRLPCILHWQLNHFVVLKKVKLDALGRLQQVLIDDPARGARTLNLSEVNSSFTGVALELTPNTEFKKAVVRRRLSIRQMLGTVVGLRSSLIQIFALAVCLEILALAAPFFTQWVVDGAIIAEDYDLLDALAIGFCGLLVIRMMISLARTWAIMFMATHLNLQWLSNVFRHLTMLPVRYFERRHLGDVASRFGSVSAIQKTLTTSFLEAIIDGLLAFLTLGVIFFYSVQLSTIVVLSVALYAVIRAISYSPFRSASEEQIILEAREQTLFLESIRAIQSIKIFNKEDDRRNRWMNAVVDMTNRLVQTQKMSLGYDTLHTAIAGIENILIIWLGARLVISGEFSVGMLFAFLSFKGTFTGRIYSLIDKFVEFKMLSVQTGRLSDIVLSRTEEQLRLTRKDGDSDFDFEAAADSRKVGLGSELRKGASCGVSIDGLSFQYAPGEEWVLEDLSLAIEQGESVAVIGPSGCGKSTLIKILAGIVAPTKGTVSIDGVSLTHAGISEYRDLLGVVMQDDQLLTGSILENISFFDVEPDLAWVAECARVASISDEIGSMPLGYRTLLGDMGSSLSGGQKQRILLARALYRRPKILLLDEATSHLDVANEEKISSSIRNLKTTRIIVAHRDETIASADRIIDLCSLMRR